jgi:hypothetical protein
MESTPQKDSAAIIHASTQKGQSGTMQPQAASEKNEASKAGKSAVHQLTGKIEAVTASQLRLKKGEQNYTFTLTGKTTVKSGAAKKQISELKVGDKVTAKYTEENGMMTARSVHLKTSSVK